MWETSRESAVQGNGTGRESLVARQHKLLDGDARAAMRYTHSQPTEDRRSEARARVTG